jgi:multiple sugar transport system permease protein
LRSLRVKWIKPYHLFIAPAFIYILLISIYPLLYGIRISFTNLRYDRRGMEWIGLANYVDFFQWEHFLPILRQSLVFLGFSVLITVVFGLFFALALNKQYWGQTAARLLAIMPWVLPAVIVGVVFQLIFSSSKMGLLNVFLRYLGAGKVTWLIDPNLAMAAVIFSFTWRTLAFSTVVLLAGLQAVPEELYEAAQIDGINSLQSFIYITLPYLRTQITVVLVLTSANALTKVDAIMSVTRGGPGRATETLAMSIYREGFEFLNAGFAASISTVVLIMNAVITVLYFYLVGRSRGELSGY